MAVGVQRRHRVSALRTHFSSPAMLSLDCCLELLQWFSKGSPQTTSSASPSYNLLAMQMIGSHPRPEELRSCGHEGQGCSLKTSLRHPDKHSLKTTGLSQKTPNSVANSGLS